MLHKSTQKAAGPQPFVGHTLCFWSGWVFGAHALDEGAVRDFHTWKMQELQNGGPYPPNIIVLSAIWRIQCGSRHSEA